MQISGPPPKLVVTSASTFWKPSEAEEIGLALDEFAELKDKFGDKVEVGATSFSETPGQKIKRKTLSWAKNLPYLLLGAGALGVSIASAGLLTPLAAAGVAGAAAGGLSMAWLGNGLSDAVKTNRNGLGSSAFHTGFERLDIPNLPQGFDAEDGLREMTVKNMSLYPGARHVAHLNGHGHGAKAFAGMPAEEAHRSMSEAVRKTGLKYDIVFYETCYGASWENLHQQAAVAEFAVAFEDAIPKSNSKIGRLDLSDILQAGIEEKSNREVAVEMAQVAGRHFDGREAPISAVPFTERLSPDQRANMSANTDSTVVAVDLAALRGQLSPSLDRLAGVLNSELQSNPKFKAAAGLAREQNLLEKSEDLVDLGGFLRQLRESVGDREKRKAFDTTLEALNSAVLYKRSGKALPLSGLSFHSRPDTVNFSSPASPAHRDPSLPQGWLRFLEQAF